MKKVNQLFTALLASLLLISCNFGANGNVEKKDDTNVILNFSYGTGLSRTITSYSDWNIESVAEWNVKFTNGTEVYGSERENKGEGNVHTYKYTLPAGEYTVEASAEVEGHTIYGKGSVEVSAESKEPASTTIYVGLKKTSGGKGTFGSFTVTFNPDYFTFAEAYLESCSNPDDVFSCNVSRDGAGKLVFEAKELSSGYYYLIIKDENETILSLEDNLVEIADGETVTGSVAALNPEVNKTFFVTTDAETIAKGYNGLSSRYPISLEKAFAYTVTNPDWKTVTMCASENLEINLAYLPAAGKKIIITETFEGDIPPGKYSLTSEGITIEEGNQSAKLNLKAAEYTTVSVNVEANNHINELTLNNVCPVFSNSVAGNVTLNVSGYNPEEKIFAYVPDECEINFITDSNKKACITTSDKENYVAYILKKIGTAGVSVEEEFPAFQIALMKGDVVSTTNPDVVQVTEGDVDEELIFKVVKQSDKTSLSEGDYHFTWKINGQKVSGSTSNFEIIKPFLDTAVALNLPGKNYISCEVSDNSTDVKHKEETFVLTINFKD